jgi:hypothetical protein
MRKFLAILLFVSAPGCFGGPEAPPAPVVPEVGVSTLTVVVWSNELQRPVPATGHLQPLGEGEVRPLDTRRAPEQGQTFTDLAPGRYRVEVRKRYLADDQTQRVEGAQTLYLEPGVSPTITVVAVDRGELGLRHEAVPASTGDRRG